MHPICHVQTHTCSTGVCMISSSCVRVINRERYSENQSNNGLVNRVHIRYSSSCSSSDTSSSFSGSLSVCPSLPSSLLCSPPKYMMLPGQPRSGCGTCFSGCDRVRVLSTEEYAPQPKAMPTDSAWSSLPRGTARFCMSTSQLDVATPAPECRCRSIYHAVSPHRVADQRIFEPLVPLLVLDDPFMWYGPASVYERFWCDPIFLFMSTRFVIGVYDT